MSNQYNFIETLLGILTDSNYKALLFRENLKIDGWKFHYLIDADIIHNYCFPRGIDPDKLDSRKKRQFSDSYYADEQVTLHSLFHLQEKNQKLIILEEYLPELTGMLKKAEIFHVHQRVIANEKFTKIGTPPVAQISSDLSHEEFKRKIKDEFSLIISQVISRIDGLKKFSTLVDEKKIILDYEDLKDSFIEDILNTERGSEKLTRYIEQLFTQLYPREIQGTLNKRRDSSCIDRLISINNNIQLSQERLKNKVVFVLVGDSPIMTDLFSILMRDPQIEFPKINGDPVPLYMPIQEYFAYLMSKSYTKTDKLDHLRIKKNISQLREASSEIKKLTSRINPYENDSKPLEEIFQTVLNNHPDLFQNYKSLRNNLENVGLLGSLHALFSSLESALKKDDDTNLKLIYTALTKDGDKLLKELLFEKEELLERLIHEARFNSSFLNGISYIQDNKSGFIISKGIDPIEGRYQHLPVFLNFKYSEISGEYHNQMYQLTELVLNQDLNKSKELCIKLEKLLINLNKTKSSSDSPIEEKLIKAFISLLLPSEITAEGKLNDLDTFAWLKEIEDRLGETTPLLNEIWYMLCWVSRRTGNYRKAVHYANLGIENFSTDPRFHHGLFLALCCDYLSDKSTQSLNKIEEMTALNEKAYYLYQPFISKIYSDKNYLLVSDKITECFTNNFCYLYTEKAKYLLGNNGSDPNSIRSYLELARSRLNNLKKTNGFKEGLCEYYHTEAYLEFIESFFPEKYSPLEKLFHSTRAIERACALVTTPDMKEKYLFLKLEIEERIKKLQLKMN